MELKKDIDQFDIPLAKRTYPNNPNSTFLKKVLIFSPFLSLISSVAAMRFIRNVELIPQFQVERNNDARILGLKFWHHYFFQPEIEVLILHF